MRMSGQVALYKRFLDNHKINIPPRFRINSDMNFERFAEVRVKHHTRNTRIVVTMYE